MCLSCQVRQVWFSDLSVEIYKNKAEKVVSSSDVDVFTYLEENEEEEKEGQNFKHLHLAPISHCDVVIVREGISHSSGRSTDKTAAR